MKCDGYLAVGDSGGGTSIGVMGYWKSKRG